MSQKCLVQFIYNLKCVVMMVEGISTAKVIGFCKGITELCIHENSIIVFPVNILMLWCACLLGRKLINTGCQNKFLKVCQNCMSPVSMSQFC